jgi:hypothetical protein
MSQKNAGGLVVLSSKVLPALAERVRELAGQNQVSVSEIINRLLLTALEEGGAKRLERDLNDEGYRAGVNQGRHEVYEHLKQFRMK